jgi:hypothetical protein
LGPTFDAAGPPGAGANEIRIVGLLTGAAEEHSHGGGSVGARDPHIPRNPLYHLIGFGVPAVGRHAEHPLRLVIVRIELVPPIGEVRPLRIVEERVRRPVQRICVVQRTTPDAGAGQHHEITQQVYALDPVATHGRRPQEVAQLPRRGGQLVVGETPPRLEHTDPVTLLRQP